MPIKGNPCLFADIHRPSTNRRKEKLARKQNASDVGKIIQHQPALTRGYRAGGWRYPGKSRRRLKPPQKQCKPDPHAPYRVARRWSYRLADSQTYPTRTLSTTCIASSLQSDREIVCDLYVFSTSRR